MMKLETYEVLKKMSEELAGKGMGLDEWEEESKKYGISYSTFHRYTKNYMTLEKRIEEIDEEEFDEYWEVDYEYIEDKPYMVTYLHRWNGKFDKEVKRA